VKRPIYDALVRFWENDRGLSILLVSLVVVLFVVPTAATRGESPSVLVQVSFQVFFTLVFLSGISASTPRRTPLMVASVVFGIALTLFWIDQYFPGAGLGMWRAGAGIVAFGMLAGLILRRTFRRGPITLYRVQGAVVVYLLLGLIWALTYQLLEHYSPGAFRFDTPPATRAELQVTLVYYSFVTLTTMGYGDIVPVLPAARSIAILEALVGQLFPAILIARLVAMELASHEHDASR
jgi:hypothetical protein